MKIFFLSILLVAFSCSGEKKQTQSDFPMHEPPTNDKVIMPEGAPMLAADKPTPAIAVDGALIISKADFKTFLDQGPAFSFTHFEFDPEKNGAVMEGYKIKAIKNSAIPYVGDALLVGDVVTHVNGMQIGTPDQYFKAWQSLGKSSKIRVDFSRESVAQHFIWVIADVENKTTQPADPVAE